MKYGINNYGVRSKGIRSFYAGFSSRRKGVGIYNFQAFTFTNGTQTGATGPSLGNLLDAYDTSENPWLLNTDFFNATSGIQSWTVPETGTYQFSIRGANGTPAGGANVNATGGRGIIWDFTVELTAEEIIKIIVGQQGLRTSSNGGGGGGTYIIRAPYTNDESIIAIAGGGGGRRTASSGIGIDGHFGQSGTANSSHSSSTVQTVTENINVISNYTPTSTSLGQGGPAANNAYGDGGAGFFGNGFGDGTGGTGRVKAQSFLNGGNGGITSDGANGGFGGGGAGQGGNGGGGGGGYTGGSGGHTAGGGGSFIINTAQNASYSYDNNLTTRDSGEFHGYVTVTKL